MLREPSENHAFSHRVQVCGQLLDRGLEVVDGLQPVLEEAEHGREVTVLLQNFPEHVRHI